MSLNIKDAVYGLGEKLGVDMSHAPASNIADTIDYISNGVGAHTGVIAEAVDKLEVGGGGGTPEWLYIVDAAPIEEGSSTVKLNKTYAEIKQVFDSDDIRFGSKIGIIRLLGEDATFYVYISSVGYNSQIDQYVVQTNNPNVTFAAGRDEDYPTLV